MIVVMFDVESVGLHGEGFAVGAVVVNVETGERLEEFRSCCDPRLLTNWLGDVEAREWLNQNLPWSSFKWDHTGTWWVRDDFWKFWRRWADKGAYLAADCAWPVEARFLADCVMDDWIRRRWQGPYPLLDLAPVLWAQGRDPKATQNRLPDEQPAHDPLADARQSARLLVEAYQHWRVRG